MSASSRTDGFSMGDIGSSRSLMLMGYLAAESRLTLIGTALGDSGWNTTALKQGYNYYKVLTDCH